MNKPQYLYDVEQGSPEWYDLRSTRMTGSHGQEIAAAAKGTKTSGKGLRTYILKKMAELYSSAEKEHYTNPDMERGNELEPIARTVYEMLFDVEVKQCGFVLDADFPGYFGISPDGLVGEDKGIEIKCHNDNKHLELILDGREAIESKYVWQIQANLYVTERKVWYYLAYNPNFEKDLLVFEFFPNEKMHEDIQEGLAIGIQLMEDIKKKVESQL